MAQNRPGKVVTVRVTPKDCQSVLHLLAEAGVTSRDKSFAECVSEALRILLESSRAGGILPEPDPFQYLNEMGYHAGPGAPDRRKKPPPYLQAAKEIVRPQVELAELYTATPQLLDIVEDPELAMQQRDAFQRANTLQNKKNAAIAKTPGILWSEAEEAELNRLNVLIFGG